jgi:hypothetical protein
MFSPQRQFERLEISGEALALDGSGRKIGRVSAVSGGGMSIELDDSHERCESGVRLRIVVEEPPTGIRHTVVVEVKYCINGRLGVEFVSPE